MVWLRPPYTYTDVALAILLILSVITALALVVGAVLTADWWKLPPLAGVVGTLGMATLHGGRFLRHRPWPRLKSVYVAVAGGAAVVAVMLVAAARADVVMVFWNALAAGVMWATIARVAYLRSLRCPPHPSTPARSHNHRSTR